MLNFDLMDTVAGRQIYEEGALSLLEFKSLYRRVSI